MEQGDISEQLLGDTRVRAVGEHPRGHGRAATEDTLAALLESGVQLFVDLTQDSRAKPYAPSLYRVAETLRMRVDYRNYRPEGGLANPSVMQAVVAELLAASSDGAVTYVHGRNDFTDAVTVAGCFMIGDGAPVNYVLEEAVGLLEKTGHYWDDVPSRTREDLHRRFASWRMPQEAIPWGASEIPEVRNRSFGLESLPSPDWSIVERAVGGQSQFDASLAPYDRFTRFALGFNGYIAYGAVHDEVGGRTYEAWQRDHCLPDELSLGDLRAVAFFLQRWWKHTGHFALERDDVRFVDAIIEAMKSRLTELGL